MSLFTSGVKVHFQAGCKNNKAMYCFGPLVMLIGLPVSDMGKKIWLSNCRNDRINISLHRAHSNNLEPVNPYKSQDPKWSDPILWKSQKLKYLHILCFWSKKRCSLMSENLCVGHPRLQSFTSGSSGRISLCDKWRVNSPVYSSITRRIAKIANLRDLLKGRLHQFSTCLHIVGPH